MFKKLNDKGFASFVEIVVTAVVFIIAAVGIFVTISMLRPHSVDSTKRLEAAYAGKEVLERLRGYIDARVWDDSTNNPLYPATGIPGAYSEQIGDYNVYYNVIDVPGTGVREIEMEVVY